MASRKNDINNINVFQRVVWELKADKRKAFLLAMLVVVSCLVFGRQLLKSPSQAGAAESGVKATAETFDSSRIDMSKSRRARIEQAKAASRDEYIRKIERNINRDLFEPNATFFPPIKEADQPRTRVSSSTKPSEEKAILWQTVHSQAASFQLQSTMISANPTAIINGRVLGIGQEIYGFKILKITPRTCEIEKESIRVTLEMMGNLKLKP